MSNISKAFSIVLASSVFIILQKLHPEISDSDNFQLDVKNRNKLQSIANSITKKILKKLKKFEKFSGMI